MQFSTTLRTALAQAIKDTVAASFTLDVRTGAGPGVGNADTGTLLATLTVGVWGSATSGAVTFTMTADSLADASGTPGHVRFKTSGGTAIIEATAGVGSGEANFDDVITANGSVAETAGTFTVGNA